MASPLTLLDLLALLALSLSLALGYRLGLGMLLWGGGGVLAYLLLAQLGLKGPWVGLGLGLALGTLAKTLPLPRLGEGVERVLGLLGGGVLGGFLALALWVGFPWEGLPGGVVRYPATSLPAPVYQAVGESPFARAAFTRVARTPWLRRALLD